MTQRLQERGLGGRAGLQRGWSRAPSHGTKAAHHDKEGHHHLILSRRTRCPPQKSVIVPTLSGPRVCFASPSFASVIITLAAPPESSLHARWSFRNWCPPPSPPCCSEQPCCHSPARHFVVLILRLNPRSQFSCGAHAMLIRRARVLILVVGGRGSRKPNLRKRSSSRWVRCEHAPASACSCSTRGLVRRRKEVCLGS